MANSIEFIYPNNPGEDLIDYNFNGMVLIIGTIVLIYVICLNVYFFIKKSKETTKGVVKKKFNYLLIATLFFGIFGILDGSTMFGLAFIFFRLGVVASWLFFYLALREESIDPKSEKKKKNLTIESGLFSLTKRPKTITEEEVIYHKDKKICLVCKGNVGGYNYICAGCDALYCLKCAQTLINLENACWVWCDV